MSLYVLVKIIHIVSATILFGTGLGTAFQMWMAHRGGDVRAIAAVARNVVLADFFFTTPAVIIQPLTGIILVRMTGATPFAPWLVAAYALYLLAGLCWIPVVWIQLRTRDLAAEAARQGAALDADYYRLMRWWCALGWPAFAAVIVIFWLMVDQPALWGQ
jgi:uncharacterized membrane protein